MVDSKTVRESVSEVMDLEQLIWQYEKDFFAMIIDIEEFQIEILGETG